MKISFRLIGANDINMIIPLIFELNEGRVSKNLLKDRLQDMITQNYQCAGIFDEEEIVGVAGLWFCTRHYVGKTVELDHVYILEDYRSKGIGKQFMQWINEYSQSKGCNSIELNTYVSNYPSHKFYYNEGMEIWGYHFFKYL